MSAPIPGLPRILGTQIGLKNLSAVDSIKQSMNEGRFDYQAIDNRLCGVRTPAGMYYIKDGHHRMAAALEILAETGNDFPARELFRWGRWDPSNEAPIDRRPLPARNWWGWFRNRLGW
jgi:hypothetical protein